MATKERKKAEQRALARKSGPAVASLKGLKMSSRKVRVIADLVRGSSVGDALIQLAFQRRAAAAPLAKLLKSAVSNANEQGLNVDSLVVDEILVHGGETGRRFMPRAQGRATRIRKRTAHVDVRLVQGV